jgi:1-acyl-sn-glycerol-3-phosphate acyltransferase
MKLVEPFARRLLRRSITIPAVVIGLFVVTGVLPALFALALVVDAVRAAGRRTFSSVRLVLFLEAALFTEVVGLSLLGLTGLVTIGDAKRRAALTFRVQRLYTGMHMTAVKSLFALHFEVEGDDLAAQPGPVLVLVRHASIVDVLIPGVFIANRHRTRLRYVLKRELLAEPCLDVAGHWIPNHFVARDGADSQREIDAVRSLKAGIGADEGVLLYPEGTRFSAGKRARILERLQGDPAARDRAQRLRHVLPVRLGGSIALLDADPRCDVLFVGHAGLEGFTSIADIWAGALAGRTIHVRFWREPASSIPEGRAAQLAWLEDRWQRLDDWLEGIEPESTREAA